MYTQTKIAHSGTGRGLQVTREVSAGSASAEEKMGKEDGGIERKAALESKYVLYFCSMSSGEPCPHRLNHVGDRA